MALGDAMGIRHDSAILRKNGPNLIGFSGMANNPGRFDIRSAPRGPHWAAWIVEPGNEKPYGSILLVGETKEEAEAHAQTWIRSPYNVPPKTVKAG
jgi:hypothetical protein